MLFRKKKFQGFFEAGGGEKSYFGGEYQSVRGGWSWAPGLWLVGLWQYRCSLDAGVEAPGIRKSARVLFLSSQLISRRTEEESSSRG